MIGEDHLGAGFLGLLYGGVRAGGISFPALPAERDFLLYPGPQRRIGAPYETQPTFASTLALSPTRPRRRDNPRRGFPKDQRGTHLRAQMWALV